MKSWISQAIAAAGSVLKALQMKQFLAVILMLVLVLPANINTGMSMDKGENHNEALGAAVREWAHQDGGQRPKTTGEWQNEERQKAPINERIKQIAEDSKEAFQEFGGGYVEGAKQTAEDVKNNAARAVHEMR